MKKKKELMKGTKREEKCGRRAVVDTCFKVDARLNKQRYSVKLHHDQFDVMLISFLKNDQVSLTKGIK